MNKLTDIKRYMRLTLNKLLRIRTDLVRLGDAWQEWVFPKLVELLRKRTDRDPKQYTILRNLRNTTLKIYIK